MASVSQIAELATHFKVFYLFGALAAAGLFAFRRRWPWLAFAIILVGIHAPGFATWYLPVPRPAAEKGPVLRVVTANLQTSNRDHDRFLDFVRDADPDILFIQETDLAWEAALEALEDTYPYHTLEARSDGYGIALFSRLPLDGLEIRRHPKAKVPAIHARLTLGGQQISILCFHALRPGPGEITARRNLQLSWIPEYVAQQDGPVIIAGDFNVTPWSPHYKAMIASSGLKNTRRGHGIAATWPGLPFPIPLLPLDHILVSPEIHTKAFRRGPNTGSDHRPLVVELVLETTRPE